MLFSQKGTWKRGKWCAISSYSIRPIFRNRLF